LAHPEQQSRGIRPSAGHKIESFLPFTDSLSVVETPILQEKKGLAANSVDNSICEWVTLRTI
jgi:hypothetical protein